MSVNPGDLVGVIQKKDPMGSTKRWFVDNGVSQGFLPAHILNPIGDDLKVVHSYDDVAPDIIVKEPTQVEECENEADESRKQMPVRKAPPVPKQHKSMPESTQTKNTLSANHHPSDQQSNHSYEEIAASEVASEVKCFLFGL